MRPPPGPERTLCCRCPDWPVVTARRRAPELAGAPVAIVGPTGGSGVAGLVGAASAEARTEGVVVGMRRREAEARCAGLVILDADPAAEARAFESVARAAEAVTPRVVLERPGLLHFPTRGPSRYFGGDDGLAARVLAVTREQGIADARVGIADGAFTAQLATRHAGSGGAHVVARGGSGAFLATWPVSVLAPAVEGGAELADLLVRLGLHTLGAFAELPAPAILARFGPEGVHAHRLAGGLDEHVASPAPPPPELIEACELDPPATRVDEAAFAAKGLADRLLGRLEELGLSCSQVVVEAETEHGERLTRCWRHERALTPAALVTRVRWQLEAWLARERGPGMPDQGMPDQGIEEATGGLVLVRIVPDRVVSATGRQLGFWGGDAAAHDRAERALVRLQGMLGHDAVVTAVPCGGRTPGEQVRWVPWGEPRDEPGSGEGPSGATPNGEVPVWPGAVPGPAPARVHGPALAARLLDAGGRPVVVSGRGEASGVPARLCCDGLAGGGGPITAWAGPWPHDLRWWDRSARSRRALWQVVLDRDQGDLACLVAVEGEAAFVEAVYD